MKRAARAFFALAVLSSLVFVLGAPAASGQVRVEAEVTYHESGDGSISGVRLQIFRAGVKVLDRRPALPCSGCELVPVPPSFQEPAQVLQLDETPEPEVVFTLYSGGAHCCIYAQAFRWDEATGRYLLAVHDFRDFGYRFKYLRGNGPPLFVSSDSRLAYRFSCFACALYPPQIWEYRGGEFIDVTRAYPRLVKRDLVRVTRAYRRARGEFDVRGILATLVAEKCLLGNCKAGFRTVRRAIRAEQARPPYLRALRRFLGRLGYV